MNSVDAGSAWRLIRDRPAAGAWNMAVDETLLEGYAAGGDHAPTLRLYGWQPPALSLGRNQAAAGAHDGRFLRAQGIDLVRRPTGGLAVLHEHERTYAVVGTLDRPPFDGGVLATYLAISRAILAALRVLGLVADARPAGGERRAGPGGNGPSCFEVVSTHEIHVAGRKLVGSAQVRRRRAFLQHGSIPIRSDPLRLARALGADAADGAGEGFTDLERATGSAPGDDALDDALVRGFAETFDVTLRSGGLSEAELARARELADRRYRSVEWTLKNPG